MEALSQAQPQQLQAYRIALAERQVELIPLVCEAGVLGQLIVERHLCIDTTAAGSNAGLTAARS